MALICEIQKAKVQRDAFKRHRWEQMLGIKRNFIQEQGHGRVRHGARKVSVSMKAVWCGGYQRGCGDSRRGSGRAERGEKMEGECAQLTGAALPIAKGRGKKE